MVRAVADFALDEEGATVIEYGLLAALIAIAAIASFTVLGNGLMNIFGSTEQGAGEVLDDAVQKVGNT